MNNRLQGPETCGDGVAQETQPVGPAVTQKVTIQQVENGFIVTVGCKTFVTTAWSEAAVELQSYFSDPTSATRKWLKRGY